MIQSCQNQMDLEMSRDWVSIGVNEATEFYRSMSMMQLTHDLAALGIIKAANRDVVPCLI